MKVQHPEILVDIYPLVAAHRAAFLAGKPFPMTGVYRHAIAWAKRCQPFIFVPEGVQSDEIPDSDTVHACTKELGLPKAHWLGTCPAGINAVVQMGLDYAPPKHSFKEFIATATAKLVTLVHDTMALRERFGLQNAATAYRSLLESDVFLPVSLSVRGELIAKLGSGEKINSYRGFIDYKKFPYGRKSQRHASVYHGDKLAIGVGGSTGYKNRKLERIVANALGYEYVHVTGVSEKDLLLAYQEADMLICLSSDEGFSIPPLEALLTGVPKLLLSNIPVHRELYQRYAHFLDLTGPLASQLTSLLDNFSRVDTTYDVPHADKEMKLFRENYLLPESGQWGKLYQCNEQDVLTDAINDLLKPA